MHRSIPFLRIVASCAAALCAASVCAQTPNLVLVMADDLGWTDVSTGATNAGNPSDYYRTPNVAALARAGMSFDHAYANGPNCTPTRAALMSGVYAARTGCYTVLGTDGAPRFRRLDSAPNQAWLDAIVPTLPEALRSVGYTTGAFGKWHLGDDPDIGPRAQGFDVNVGGTGAGSVTGGSDGHFARADGSWDLPNLRGNGVAGQFMADRLTDEAIAWMGANAQRRFFCCLSQFSVHTPIQAPVADRAAFDGVAKGERHRDQTYAGMLKNFDDNLGRVVRFLETTPDPNRPGRALIANTVVIFCSDNGGLGGYASDGVAGGKEITHQAPLRSGKGSLYEGGIRVPMIVRWDGVTAADTVSHEPILTFDLFPTLARIAGSILPPEGLDGVNFTPVLLGTGDLAPRPLLWHFPSYVEASATLGTWITTPASAIRRGDWKLLFFYETRTWELYDLAADLGERHNLAAREPERVRALGGELRRWLQATRAEMPRYQGTDDPVPLPDPGGGSGDTVDWRRSTRTAPELTDAIAASDGERVLAFGGADAHGPVADLWSFDGAQWTRRSPVHRPAARRAHVGWWDRTARRLLVFGGELGDGLLECDTWSFDGSDWQRLVVGSAPAPRADAAVATHGGGGAVLFGGRSAVGVLGDTWAFDGRRWRERTPPAAPSPRAGHAMVATPTDRILLFGGVGANGVALADTWSWDGSTWREVSVSSAPPARSEGVLTWDAARGRGVLWGGRDHDGFALGDTWEFDGAAWQRREPVAPPLAAHGASGVFVASLERTVVFGGRNGVRTAGTWEYGATALGRTLHWGKGCGGLGLATTDRPWVGDGFTTWVRGVPGGTAAVVVLTGFPGDPPIDLAAVGAPGCSLYVAPRWVASHAAGAGDVRAVLRLPRETALIGLAFDQQALAPAPLTNALGIVTSNALRGVVGAR